jgi:hypothetical protein
VRCVCSSIGRKKIHVVIVSLQTADTLLFTSAPPIRRTSANIKIKWTKVSRNMNMIQAAKIKELTETYVTMRGFCRCLDWVSFVGKEAQVMQFD